MNGKSARPGGSLRTSSQSLQALMYAATLGIAIVGAWSVSLEADAQERANPLEHATGSGAHRGIDAGGEDASR